MAADDPTTDATKAGPLQQTAPQRFVPIEIVVAMFKDAPRVDRHNFEEDLARVAPQGPSFSANAAPT